MEIIVSEILPMCVVGWGKGLDQTHIYPMAYKFGFH